MSSFEIIFFKNLHLIFYHLRLNDDFLVLLLLFFFNFQCFLLKIVYHFRKHEFIKILQQIYDTLKMRALVFHKETLLNSAELKTTIRDGYPEKWRPP